MTFQELRICFLWVERRPDGADWKQVLPAPFLQSDTEYANRYEEMLSGKPAGQAALPYASPPWPSQTPSYRHFFWRRYLEREPQSISGQYAFRKLAPFRTGFPARLRTDEKGVRVIRDGYVYPHAIAVVLTVRVALDQKPWPADGVSTTTALNEAVKVYRTTTYTLELEDGTKSTGTLATAAGTLLDQLRKEVFGDTKAGARSENPFVVAAVVRGSIDDQNGPPQEGHDDHQALQGLCTLDEGWQSNQLTPYRQSLLPHRKTKPASHVVYQTNEARTIWFPVQFSDTDGVRRTIGCYQRNLVLLHLQIRSLLEALKMRSELIEFGDPVPPQLDAISKTAAREIGNLYLGATYRSMSAKAYLDAHAQDLERTEKARASFGMDPLNKKEAKP